MIGKVISKQIILGIVAGLIYWLFHPDWFAPVLAILSALLFDNQAALTRRVQALERQLEETHDRLARMGADFSDTNAHLFDLIARPAAHEEAQ